MTNKQTYDDFLARHLELGIELETAKDWAAADARAEARSEWFKNDIAYRNGKLVPKSNP